MALGDIKRIIPLDEVGTKEPEIAKLAVIFNHDVVQLIGDDRWQWRSNRLMNVILRDVPVFTPSETDANAHNIKDPWVHRSATFRASLELNQLITDLFNGYFSCEEYMKFYMQIGYSIDGFWEVFGQHEASEWKLPGAKAIDLDSTRYTEHVIDYMIRVHGGTVLKL